MGQWLGSNIRIFLSPIHVNSFTRIAFAIEIYYGNSSDKLARSDSDKSMRERKAHKDIIEDVRC